MGAGILFILGGGKTFPQAQLHIGSCDQGEPDVCVLVQIVGMPKLSSVQTGAKFVCAIQFKGGNVDVIPDFELRFFAIIPKLVQVDAKKPYGTVPSQQFGLGKGGFKVFGHHVCDPIKFLIFA